MVQVESGELKMIHSNTSQGLDKVRQQSVGLKKKWNQF